MIVKIFEKQLLLPEGMLVVEHSSEWDFSEMKWFQEIRSYGRVNFSFFRNTVDGESG
jgi:hypothetical protein